MKVFENELKKDLFEELEHVKIDDSYDEQQFKMLKQQKKKQ